LVALDPDSGKLKWYFQFTPHDLFDYDATETPVLIDAVYHGQARKLLIQANRNGFLYILDRESGKFLSATRFVDKLNWAKDIDANGRPVRTEVEPSAAGTRVCPSYNEITHLFYFKSLEECQTYFRKPEKFVEGQTYYSTGVKHIPGEERQRFLLAFNLDTEKFAWRYPQISQGWSAGGTMTTAGGLVFFGDDAQSLEALDGQSGKPLWHFNTGQSIDSSPMTYAVGDKQYVAIAAGSDLFTFSLANSNRPEEAGQGGLQ
jgi:alcohol dehydrogenase (cytochrome c)